MKGQHRFEQRLFRATPLVYDVPKFLRHTDHACPASDVGGIDQNGRSVTVCDLWERETFSCAETCTVQYWQFCDRQMRKLRRHIADRDIDGVPNFVHIFLAINALLRSRIERAIHGLEARDGLVSTYEWALFRELCNIYYERFREVTSCFLGRISGADEPRASGDQFS